LGHHQGFLQGPLYLDAEPVLDATGDEMDGNYEEDHGGHQGQANEGQDQLGLQLRSQDLLLPFKDQFDNIAQDEKNQEEKKDDVEPDEGDHQDVAGHRDLVCQLGNMGLKKEEQPDHAQEKENQDDLPPSPLGGLILALIFRYIWIRVHSPALLPAFIPFFKSFNILPDTGEKSKD
jgi:hypothetical protein